MRIGSLRPRWSNGRAGWVRLDSVHQGNLDGIKGVYHINSVVRKQKVYKHADVKTPLECLATLSKKRLVTFKWASSSMPWRPSLRDLRRYHPQTPLWSEYMIMQEYMARSGGLKRINSEMQQGKFTPLTLPLLTRPACMTIEAKLASLQAHI